MYRYVHLPELPASPFVKDSVKADKITPDFLIENFKLKSWQAKKAPNHDLGGKGIDDSFYVYRSNTNPSDTHEGKILHKHVTKRWPLIQFSDGAKWFEPFIKAGSLTISSALIVNDQHFGVTCDLGLTADVGGGDTLDRYFMLSLSHSPGMPRILGFTDIRAVCENTLMAAASTSLAKADGCFNLDANGDDAMKTAARTLNLLERRFNEVDVPAYKHMRNIKVTEAERDLLYRQLLGMPLEGKDVSNRILEAYETLHETYISSPGMELFDANEHTGWRVLQGVTWSANALAKTSLDGYLQRFKAPSFTKKTHKWLELRFDREVKPLGTALQPA